MEIDIISLFPDYFTSPFNQSIIKRAREKGLVSIRLIDIRDFANDKHRTVDDRPYGGGPGMLLKPEPVVAAIRSVRKVSSRVIYLSPQGSLLKASLCEEMATSYEHIILLCGHYEGVDERVIQLEVDAEVSIGDYVLTSGMPAALVFVDAVIRFVPDVLGHRESAYQDSFHSGEGFDAPQFTRPPVFEGLEVPKVLVEGHHKEIEKWRKQTAQAKTKKVRPDLDVIN